MATNDSEDETSPSPTDLGKVTKQLLSKLKDWAPISAALLFILAVPVSKYCDSYAIGFGMAFAITVALLCLRGWQMWLESGVATRKVDSEAQAKLAKIQTDFQLKAMKLQIAASGPARAAKVPKRTLKPPGSP